MTSSLKIFRSIPDDRFIVDDETKTPLIGLKVANVASKLLPKVEGPNGKLDKHNINKSFNFSSCCAVCSCCADEKSRINQTMVLCI